MSKLSVRCICSWYEKCYDRNFLTVKMFTWVGLTMACNERVSKDERVRDASEYRAVNNVPTCTELNVCVCLYVVHPLSWRWKVFLDIFLLFLVWNIFSYISCKSFSRYTQFWMLSMAHLPRKMDGIKQSTNNIVLFLLLRFLSLFLSSSSSFSFFVLLLHIHLSKNYHTPNHRMWVWCIYDEWVIDRMQIKMCALVFPFFFLFTLFIVFDSCAIRFHLAATTDEGLASNDRVLDPRENRGWEWGSNSMLVKLNIEIRYFWTRQKMNKKNYEMFEIERTTVHCRSRLRSQWNL